MRKHLQQLTDGDDSLQHELPELLEGVGFRDVPGSLARLKALSGPPDSAELLTRLLHAITDMIEADELLVDFERYVLRVGDRNELFRFLNEQPRGLEQLD